MGWDFILRIGQYFGVVKKKDADNFLGDIHQSFYFEIGENGELFIVADDDDDDEFLEEEMKPDFYD